MLKKVIALALVLAVACAGVIAAPAALAAEYYSAETPLNGASADKLNNITLAAKAIDGAVIPGGEGFSFNAAVGPRAAWRGYKRAPNGRGAMVTGGGVAQVASTLYLAVLQMDEVDIDPVRTYGSRFVDDYVSDPEHAVVTDYDADIDFSFTNLGDDMTVDLWVDGDSVCCSIRVGEDDDAGFWTTGDGGDADEDDEDGDVSLPLLTPSKPNAPVCASSLYTGDDADVRNNVVLAAECVNDTTLATRDVFSFNDIVGPRAQKYGYVRATNGRGVKVVGGGVAQVASALWLAIKDWDGASIVEKSTYGDKYNQDYVESSADAILTDYSSGRDFSFRYTGPGAVTIYTWVEDGELYCRIYEN